MTAVAQSPLQQDERLLSLDIIRGVALFGILLMNITSFGLPFAYADPTVYGGATGPNLWAWITTTMLFEGTQRGLFSLLFGAGAILLTARIEARGGDAADVFFRRNLWLIVFGIVHGFVLLWTGEILFYYGATALFVFAFRKATPRTLIAVALGGLLFNAAWNQLDAYNGLKKHAAWQEARAAQASGAALTRKQEGALKTWQDLLDDMKPSAEKIQDKLQAMRGSYGAIVVHQAPVLTHHQSWWMYRYFFDLFSLMLLGMALFKLGLLHLGHGRGVYVWMVALGYGIGLSVNYLELRHVLGANFDVLARMKVEVTYDLGRLAMTTGHLGLLMLFCNSGLLGWLQRRLAAVGQMALSNYVTHSIVCAVLFDGFGFGLYGQLQRHQLYYVVVSIWCAQLVVSPIWLAHYRFGPVEWLWRTLTYGQWQPMRRRVARPGAGEPLAAPAA
ncbi:MAG: DUF418 domain-containing protein [Acidobacteria bacterium]|nr:DUF418 domain-containing protein [Acidobacteriota bacterium]